MGHRHRDLRALWGGARDFLLILIEGTDYIAGQFGQGGLAYFADYPLLLRIVWSVNIFGGLTAPILLVAASQWAVPVTVLAGAAQVVLLAVRSIFLGRVPEGDWLPILDSDDGGKSQTDAATEGGVKNGHFELPLKDAGKVLHVFCRQPGGLGLLLAHPLRE